MGNDLEDKLLQRTGIRAVVKEGDFGILVEGSIANEDQRHQAIEVIREIAPTEKKVIDRLHVVADPHTNVDPTGEVLLTTVGRGGMDDRWGFEEDKVNLGDTALYDAVMHVLREDETTAGAPIDVRVDNGRVFLTGSGLSDQVAEHALRLAQEVPGVTEVHGELHGHVA